MPFTVAVGPAAGSRPVQEVTDFASWELDNNLDEGCSVTFGTRGVSPAALSISELDTDVWLYRGSTLVQRFRVVEVLQQWDADGNDVVQIGSVCYRRLLKARHVLSPLAFSGVSQGQIVFDLIEHTQSQTNGGLGITAEDLGPSILRDREYQIGQNIYDAIVELSLIDQGIAWDIDGTLGLIVGTQTGFPTRTQPIELGVNARQLERPSSAAQFGNVAVVVGNNEATVPEVVPAPGLGVDPRGRWERFASVTQSSQADLVEFADGLVQAAISPVSTWTVEMEPDRYFLDSDYEVGDFVTLVVPRSTVYAVGVPAPRVRVQILSRNISQSADGEVRVIVTAVEAPAP